MGEFFAQALEARDITDLNIAAGEAQQALALAKRSITQILWTILAVILISDLLPIGPLDLGLVPDVHLLQWVTGHPMAHAAGVALYHVQPESPHILGVSLPWGELY